MRFTFTLQTMIILKHVKSGYMTKSLYNLSTFSYFVVHVVMLDLFELWWLTIEYNVLGILFLFITLNYLEQNSYHLLLELLYIWLWFFIIWMLWIKVINLNVPYLCKYFYLFYIYPFIPIVVCLGQIFNPILLVNVHHFPLLGLKKIQGSIPGW